MAKRGAAKEQQFKTALRRKLVVQLRLRGVEYRKIAQAVKKQYNDDCPQGYDERYAYKDFKRELEKLQKEVREETNELRLLQLERLDRMLEAMYEKALSGRTKEVYAVLAIMERIARLTGMDAPEVIEMNQNYDVQLTWDNKPVEG